MVNVKGLLLIALCAGVALAPACRQRQAPPVPRQVLRVSMAFGPFTRLLVQEFRTAFPGMDLQMVNGTDSRDAVQAIEQDRADLGLAYADAVFSSYSATEGTGKSSHIRGVSLLEPLPLYFLARTSSGIRQASDIRGHRLAVAGTGALASWTLGGLVLDALGVETSAIESLPTRQAIQAALTDGTIDAVLLSGWLPSTAAVFSDLRASIVVVPVDGPPIDQLRREYPFVRSVTVPLVLYPGQQRPVITVGMDVLVICRSDLDEALVHDATKELFVVYPRLSGVEATLRFLKLDEAPATPIPLHPGAARYFRERELSR